MTPSPYLFFVSSSPTQISDKVWEQWYVDEHIPDLVRAKTCTRAMLYEEIALPTGTSKQPRRFLALYQTEFPELLKTEGFSAVSTTSDLFTKAGSGSDEWVRNGDFDARNYELIQNFEPKEIGEVPPIAILTVELHSQHPQDLGRWYREDKIPGYRRSLRYRLGPETPFTKDGDMSMHLAIHEVDDLAVALTCGEAKVANAMSCSETQRKESKVLASRGWKLLYSEGF